MAFAPQTASECHSHGIQVWSPRSPTSLRFFSVPDLDEAIRFADRLARLPQVGKIEVLENTGGFRYRDYFEIEKDWYRSALRTRSKTDDAEKIRNAKPLSAAEIAAAIIADPGVESCNECANDGADPKSDRTMNGYVWIPSISGLISNDGKSIRGAGYPAVGHYFYPGFLNARRIARAIKAWRVEVGIPPKPGHPRYSGFGHYPLTRLSRLRREA